MNELFTVSEVGKILKLKDQTILSYIKLGKLKAIKLDRGYRVVEDDLQRFIEAKKIQ